MAKLNCELMPEKDVWNTCRKNCQRLISGSGFRGASLKIRKLNQLSKKNEWSSRSRNRTQRCVRTRKTKSKFSDTSTYDVKSTATKTIRLGSSRSRLNLLSSVLNTARMTLKRLIKI